MKIRWFFNCLSDCIKETGAFWNRYWSIHHFFFFLYHQTCFRSNRINYYRGKNFRQQQPYLLIYKQFWRTHSRVDSLLKINIQNVLAITSKWNKLKNKIVTIDTKIVFVQSFSNVCIPLYVIRFLLFNAVCSLYLLHLIYIFLFYLPSFPPFKVEHVCFLVVKIISSYFFVFFF